MHIVPKINFEQCIDFKFKMSIKCMFRNFRLEDQVFIERGTYFNPTENPCLTEYTMFLFKIETDKKITFRSVN